MDVSSKSIVIGLIVAFVLIIQPFVSAQQGAEDNNKNQSQNNNSENRNNTRAIVDLKNHTVTVIDTRTNETISVKNFTVSTGNNTTNKTATSENISGSTGNMLANESKSTINAPENYTGSLNLTEKFKELGK